MATGKSRVDGQFMVETGHDPVTKTGGWVPEDLAETRLRSQTYARHRDTMVETDRSRTRQARDRDRFYPRPADTNVKARAGRRLPAAAAARVPLAAAQARHLKRNRRAAQAAMPKTEVKALRTILASDAWETVNTVLTDRVDGIRDLAEPDRILAQRVDRAIRRAETANDRTHVVYARLKLDEGTDASDLTDLPAGTTFTLDEFTAAGHSPHRAADDHDQDQYILVEIEGSRGMYLGDDEDHSGHLLPRGLQIETVGYSTADIIGPDGPHAHLPILQTRTRKDPEYHDDQATLERQQRAGRDHTAGLVD